MVHARKLLQNMKVANGAQCMGMLAITSLALMLKSPERRARLFKEERIGQSAATGYTLLQQATKHTYIPEKG